MIENDKSTLVFTPLDNIMSNSGQCAWFSADRGYGFITPDHSDKREDRVFVHQTALKMDGFRKLRKGDMITFDIENDDTSRFKAVNVTRV